MVTRHLEWAWILLLSVAIPTPLFADRAQEPPRSSPASSSYLEYLSEPLRIVHGELEDALSMRARERVSAKIDSLLVITQRGSVEYADLLDLKTLAALKLSISDPTERMGAALEAMELRQRHPRDEARLATTYYVLGGALISSGDAQAGMDALRESLRLRLRDEEGDPRAIAMSWHGLGNAFFALGANSSAVRSYDRAQRAFELAGAGEDWAALLSLWSSSMPRKALGHAEMVHEIHERVLAEILSFMTVENELFAELESEVATSRALSGDLDGAWELAQRALAQLDKLGRKNSRLWPLMLGDLGSIAARRHELDLALEYANAALVASRESGSPTSLISAFQFNVWSIRMLRGETDHLKALRGSWEPSDHEALDAPQFNAWVSMLGAVAALRESEPGLALERALVADRFIRDSIRSEIMLLRAEEALVAAKRRTATVSVAACAAIESRDPAAISSVWRAAADARATATDVLQIRTRKRREEPRSSLRGLAERARELRSQIDRISVGGSENAVDLQLTLLRREVARLEDQLLLADIELEHWGAGIDPRESEVDYDHDRTFAGLPDGAALVSFMRLDRINREGESLDGFEYRWTVAPDLAELSHPYFALPSYAAFVREPTSGKVHLIDLGPAAAIDSAIAAWRSSIDDVEDGVESGQGRNYTVASQSLRRLLWDPIADHVEDAELILTIPDGAIHFVNFDGLETDEGRFLAEVAPLIHTVSSERALARVVEPRPRSESESVLVVAGPTFAGRAPALADVDVVPDDDTLGPRRGVAIADDRSDTFHPLPGALLEGRQIARLFENRNDDSVPVTLLTGHHATERRVATESKHHSILHFATHAFVRPWEGDGVMGLETTAGIALAGVDLEARDDADDGLLFTHEILRLDLEHTDWVVLSACETGLGEVEPGEGVRGLRDAFESAGARTLILSLWKVHDQPTREWMLALYRARLSGASTAQAMRQANLEILRARRARGDDTNPLYWASFVATGDWR